MDVVELGVVETTAEQGYRIVATSTEAGCVHVAVARQYGLARVAH